MVNKEERIERDWKIALGIFLFVSAVAIALALIPVSHLMAFGFVAALVGSLLLSMGYTEKYSEDLLFYVLFGALGLAWIPFVLVMKYAEVNGFWLPGWAWLLVYFVPATAVGVMLHVHYTVKKGIVKPYIAIIADIGISAILSAVIMLAASLILDRFELYFLLPTAIISYLVITALIGWIVLPWLRANMKYVS